MAKKSRKGKKLSIRKRNGEVVEFSKKKVKEALKVAGAAAKEANEIADKIASHAKKSAKEGIITAVEIERGLVDFLVKRNKEITENFKKATKKW